VPTTIFRYDTLDLQDEANGLAVSAFVLPDRTRVPSEVAPRRHGVVRTEEPTLTERVLAFSGTIKQATAALLRTKLDDVLKTMNGTEKQFYLYDTTRYIVCTKTEFRSRFRPGPAMTVLDYDCELFASDPFWIAATGTTDTQTASNWPTSALSWTHTNSGSALVFPTYTVTANVAGAVAGPITLTNSTTGKSWTFSATIASGKSMVFNTANFTVTNDGADAINSMTGVPVWLTSGSNSLSFSGGNATFKIAYNARYYGP